MVGIVVKRTINSEKYRFWYSGYDGYEDQVLSIRNRNRKEQKDRTYMDWRYRGQPGIYDPIVVWVSDENENSIGMAALIFHPYWIGNQIYHIPQLGDISLDKPYRGKGIAQKLFKFINNLIEEKKLPGALVLPNSAASRGLLAAGWDIVAHIDAYVFILNPYRYISNIVKNRYVSDCVNSLYKRFVRFVLLKFVPKNTVLAQIGLFNKDYDDFWRLVHKQNLILRDKSSGILNWRYRDYNKNKFRAVKISSLNKTNGYVVYYCDKTNACCYIYDAIVINGKELLTVLSKFLFEMSKTSSIETVRIMVNHNYIFSKYLRLAGFIRRKTSNFLLFYTPKITTVRIEKNWSVSSGDKDT